MDSVDLGCLYEIFNWHWLHNSRSGCLFVVCLVITTVAGYFAYTHGLDLYWIIGIWLVINLGYYFYILYIGD